MRLVDGNTWKYWAISALVAVPVWLFHPGSPLRAVGMYALLWVGVHATLDLLYYSGLLTVYDPELVIQRGYDLSAQTIDSPHSEGLDYGFNLYDGDFAKPRAQAQV